MDYPSRMKVADLNRKHCWHEQHEGLWSDLDLLYRGGVYIKQQAARFLIKRPREVAEVYNQRLARFSYQNVIGTSLGWYLSAMGERPAEIEVRRGDAEVEGGGEYAAFLANCNRGGRSFAALFADVFLDLLLYRSCFVLTDLPAPGQYATREEQRLAGALDPYLVRYNPRSVLNWETDAVGNLEWVVIRTESERRLFGADIEVVTRWYVFDRERAAVYELVTKQDESTDGREASLVVEPVRHALADVGRVPVRMIEVPDGLWLAHRAYLPTLDHLNQDNSFGWALFMANLPIPVVKGKFQGQAAASESALIQLEPNGEFSYAEPSGVSFQHAANRCDSLREEIHRVMYLQAQARTQSATPAAQSGVSKEADMAPSQRVLSGLGEVLKDGMSRVLRDVADARGDSETMFQVAGFDFEEDDSRDLISTAQGSENLGIHSDTFRRQLHKRVARQVLRGERDETLQKIDQEIDAGPTMEEQAKAEAAATADRIGERLAAAAGVAR